MEENKVTLTLKEYLELYEGQKENNKEMEILLELIFQNTELANNKEDIKFDYYNSKLMRFLKENYPERYQKQVDYLKSEED